MFSQKISRYNEDILFMIDKGDRFREFDIHLYNAYICDFRFEE